MLLLAGVHRGDVLYDLGCGDGRIPILASQLYGTRGVGIDIDPVRTEISRHSARKQGVLGCVTFRTEDLFVADISEATVVTLFLWPEVTRVLGRKLRRDLKPGTRVVSYFWEIAAWVPDKEIAVDGRPIYLWTIPPKPPRPVASRTRVGSRSARVPRQNALSGCGACVLSSRQPRASCARAAPVMA
jgi:SAM-dependent methyltransferase